MLKRLLLRFNDVIKQKGIMRFWLWSYIAVLFVMLFLFVCTSSIFFSVVRDDTVNLKKEEIRNFSGKMDLLTEEGKLFAAKIAANKDIKETFTRKNYNAKERFEVKEIVKPFAEQMKFLDEFFVYVKSTNIIINSLGYICTPEEYYSIHYKSTNMDFKTWYDNFLNNTFSGYYVFEVPQQYGTDLITKFCYVLPTRLIDRTEVTICTIIDSAQYSEEVARFDTNGDMSVLIYNDASKRYFEKGRHMPTDEQLTEMEKADGFYTTHINGEKVVMNFVSSEFASWRYAFVIPYESFWAKLGAMRYMNVLAVVLIAVLGIVGIYIITKYNYRPIADIVNKIERKFLLDSSKEENEYEQINRVIDSASDLSDALEKQTKQAEMGKTMKLLLGLINHEITAERDNYSSMFNTDTFVVAVFCTATYEKLFTDEQMNNSERFSVTKMIISNIFTEMLKPYGVVHEADMVNMVFLFSPNDKYISQSRELVMQKAEETAETIYKYFELNLTCGISIKHTGISSISTAYKEALEALNTTLRSEKAAVSAYRADNISAKSYYYPIEQAQHLISLLNNADNANALRHMDMILETNQDILLIPHLRKALFTDMAGTIMKAALNVGYNIDTEKLMSYVNVEEYSAFSKIFESYVNEVCNFINSGSFENMDSLVKKINRIIENDYLNVELNINMIAETLGMNASYLSAVYKQRTSIRIIDKIHSLRINEAKKLVLEEELTMEAIAQKTGFGTTTSFNRVFKKVVGISPREYRNINS